jgi:choline dehydrogenase-like flavoprotein
MQIDGREIKSKTEITTDVSIVGSGSGGSFLASELSAFGLKTVLIEAGNYYTAKDFNQREEDMYPALYMAKGQQFTKDMTISVLQGRCVGGSPVVNMCDCVPVSESTLKFWEKKFNVKGIDYGDMKEIVNKIYEKLKVNKIKDEDLNKNNLKLKEGTEKSGYRGETFYHNRHECVGCGYCLIGCAYDVKQNTLTVYVPEALKYGTELIFNCSAERLIIEKGRVSGVSARSAGGGELKVNSKVVILACSAIHTPRILLNSEIIKNRHLIGKNLSLQPQLPIVAWFNEKITGYRGTPQAYCCNEFETSSEENGSGGFRIEGIFSGPGMSSLFIPEFGIEQKNLMSHYTEMSASLLLFPDRPCGNVSYRGDGKPVIDYKLSDELIQRIKKAIILASKIYFTAGAKMVMVPLNVNNRFNSPEEVEKALEQIDFSKIGYRMISAHPQGTCRMGSDPLMSVVDTNCESHEVKGLFVCDSSIFPTTASSHTMIPIFTMAYRTARYIKENVNKYT